MTIRFKFFIACAVIALVIGRSPARVPAGCTVNGLSSLGGVECAANTIYNNGQIVSRVSELRQPSELVPDDCSKLLVYFKRQLRLEMLNP